MANTFCKIYYGAVCLAASFFDPLKTFGGVRAAIRSTVNGSLRCDDCVADYTNLQRPLMSKPNLGHRVDVGRFLDSARLGLARKRPRRRAKTECGYSVFDPDASSHSRDHHQLVLMFTLRSCSNTLHRRISEASKNEAGGVGGPVSERRQNVLAGVEGRPGLIGEEFLR